MKRNKGQGLVEYALVLVLCAVVVVVIVALFSGALNSPPCDKVDPTAGDVVSCIATRTAEARNK